MVTEKDFVFDYSSAFEYGPAGINMKNSYKKSNYKSAFTYRAISVGSDSAEDSDVKSTETFLSAAFRSLLTLVLYAVTIISFPISCWMCIKKVHSLERIVSMRLGKMQPVRGPGFVFVLPCVDKWDLIDLRPHSFMIPLSQILTSDRAIVEVETQVEYRVSDVLSYVLKLNHHENFLQDLSHFSLRNAISGKELEDLQMKSKVIAESVKDDLNQNAVKWGLEISSVSIHSVRILKEAEPIDAIGTLMNALKAATAPSPTTNFSGLVPPFNQTGLADPGKDDEKKKENNGSEFDCVEELKRYVDKAPTLEQVVNMKAKVKMTIKGKSTQTVVLDFEEGGKFSVVENCDGTADSDIQLELSEEHLREFLSGELSPTEAFMGGKVGISGDWNLIRPFSQMFASLTA